MYKTISELCRKQHTSVRQVEIALGFYNGTIHRWDDPNTPIPLGKVKAVAEHLHVDPYTLLLVGIDMDRVEAE